MVARVVIAALALAAAGWLAVELGSATAQEELVAIAFDERPRATARAEELARRARVLNPDSRVDGALAVLALRTGDTAGAVAGFERLTRKEPRNAELWLALSRAARGYDDALSNEARQKVRQLVPPLRTERH